MNQHWSLDRQPSPSTSKKPGRKKKGTLADLPVRPTEPDDRYRVKFMDSVESFVLEDELAKVPLSQCEAAWRDKGYVWWLKPFQTGEELYTKEQLGEALWHAQIQTFLTVRRQFKYWCVFNRDPSIAGKSCFAMLLKLIAISALGRELMDMGVLPRSKDNITKLQQWTIEVKEAFEARFSQQHPELCQASKRLNI